MSSTLARLSSRRILGVILAAVLVGATVGVVVAAGSNPGPFTGCLDKKGSIYNVAESATTPLFPCKAGETIVAFSNGQGATGATGATGRHGCHRTDWCNGGDRGDRPWGRGRRVHHPF